jgi:hypothetical protein
MRVGFDQAGQQCPGVMAPRESRVPGRELGDGPDPGKHAILHNKGSVMEKPRARCGEKTVGGIDMSRHGNNQLPKRGRNKMNAGKTRTLLRLSMPAEPKKDGRRGSHAQPGPLTSEDAAMLATATGAHSLPANVGTTDVQPSDKAHGAHP